jgi:acetoacetyl-CoA reductase
MMIDLSGRRALVTGGSGAIGRSICLYLARAGVHVIANCTEDDFPAAQQHFAALREPIQEIAVSAFDVSDPLSCAVALTQIEQAHGEIDILINCAGITRDAPLHKMSIDQWQQVMRVDLDSVFNVSRPLIAGMLARGWGRIVNIASVNGQKGQFGQTNYSAAKAGVHGFTMALAQEVARKGLTVNTVSPGYIDSPMIRAVPDGIRHRILESIPAGRFGDPADVAAAVVFLCSAHASFINGANLPINGAQYTSA